MHQWYIYPVMYTSHSSPSIALTKHNEENNMRKKTTWEREKNVILWEYINCPRGRYKFSHILIGGQFLG